VRGISDAQADAIYAGRRPPKTDQEIVRDGPSRYLGENARSRSPLRRPIGLYDLLRWFEAATLAEIPSRLHQAALWHEHVTEGTEGGGSRLGAHAWADEFRRYLEGSPFGQDPDGFYQFPILAALAKLEGTRGWQPDSANPPPSEGAVMAAMLRGIARNAFSYTSVAILYSPLLPAATTEKALERLYEAYRSEAPARIIKEAA
jgi:hypothetical protein